MTCTIPPIKGSSRAFNGTTNFLPITIGSNRLACLNQCHRVRRFVAERDFLKEATVCDSESHRKFKNSMNSTRAVLKGSVAVAKLPNSRLKSHNATSWSSSNANPLSLAAIRWNSKGVWSAETPKMRYMWWMRMYLDFMLKFSMMQESTLSKIVEVVQALSSGFQKKHNSNM